MYCKNCGNDITGMKYCSKCGTAVEDNSVNTASEPYSTVQTVKADKSIKVMGWILALLPLLGIITMQLPDSIYKIIYPGIIGLNIGLWFTDKTMLKKQRYTGKWTWWGLVLVPVYLYFRAKKTGAKYTQFIINIIAILLVAIIAFVPLGSKQYSINYKWWENYGKSYTSTLDSGAEYLTHEISFICNENGKRNIFLYADENRDGSTHLEFYSVVNGENYLLLTADSLNADYSTDFDVHSWTYKWTNPKGDEITISFIAEEKSLSVTSGYELFGIYGNGGTLYNQMRSGTYYPVK